jgi:hypothetical protein
MFLDRHRRAGKYLEWKVRVFTVAAVLGLAGIAIDNRWLTGAAIVVLTGGVSLRFLPDGSRTVEGDEEGEEATEP